MNNWAHILYILQIHQNRASAKEPSCKRSLNCCFSYGIGIAIGPCRYLFWVVFGGNLYGKLLFSLLTIRVAVSIPLTIFSY